MPKLSVWLVRASLIHMGIGFFFGSMILHHKGVPIYPWTWRLLNPHIEIMIFGWTMQFVMGIAFWILPRFSGGDFYGDKGRFGRTYLGWWSFALLNSGILITALSGWYMIDLLSLLGRLCTLGAVVPFALLLWPRIKPLGGFTASQGPQNYEVF
ncbi:MAG: hypothetical protein IT328_10730 [Caldilineaceae bacterium]|nr:hypothetical protein [Caldilineaceae bacterium]